MKIEKGGEPFSPRHLELSARIQRIKELHPKRINLEQFKNNQTYQLAALIYGKDHINITDIPAKVLVEVIMRALDQVAYKCEQLGASKKVLDSAFLQGFSQDSQLDLPKGVSCDTVGVYASFSLQEFNPVSVSPIIQGLEEYKDMIVVIADTGFYLWLPVGNRLVEITPDLLESIFEKDRFFAQYFLWGIKRYIEFLVNEATRQLWLITPLQDEINLILKHISFR